MHNSVKKAVIFVTVLIVAVTGGAWISVWTIDRVGVDFLAGWSRYVAFLYVGLIGIVVQLISKLHNIVDIDLLRYEQIKRLSPVIKEKTKRLWVLCAFYLSAAVISVLFPVLRDIDETIGYVGAFLICMCLILALVFSGLVAVWFEEVRDLKWKLAAANRADREREGLLREMRESVDDLAKDESLDGGKRVRH